MNNFTIRQIDELGRVVIPIDARRILGIYSKDEIEMFVDGENIVFQKHEPICNTCGQSFEVKVFKGKNICESCIQELKSY